MKSDMTTVVLALGSNYEQKENIAACKEMLQMLFPNVVFTQELWTEPVGMASGRFLNCLARIETTHTQRQMLMATKHVEAKCGNKKSLRSMGIVPIDVDILLYGDQKLHLADWEREYVKVLMNDLTRSL